MTFQPGFAHWVVEQIEVQSNNSPHLISDVDNLSGATGSFTNTKRAGAVFITVP